MRTVRLRIRGYGKEPKYGPNVWKFCAAGCYLLQREGWKVVHRGQSYWYLSPPEGATGGKSPVLALAIPDDGEITALAQRLHAAGKPDKGMYFGWPVFYEPRRIQRYRVTHQRLGGPTWDEDVEKELEAEFRIGMCLIWSVSCHWDAGDDREPRLYVAGKNIVEEVAA
jgi:hypothetical protein